jgi:hypothetical protein
MNQQATGALEGQDQDLATTGDPVNTTAGDVTFDDSLRPADDLTVQDAHGHDVPPSDASAQAAAERFHLG